MQQQKMYLKNVMLSRSQAEMTMCDIRHNSTHNLSQWIVHFEWVNFLVREFYPNKVVFKIHVSRGFPGHPVVRTLVLHCQGLVLIPGQGTKILQAAQCSKKKKRHKWTYLENIYRLRHRKQAHGSQMGKKGWGRNKLVYWG